jgi:hypothetical protein
MKTLIPILIFLLCFETKAQNYNLPQGYIVYKDAENKPFRIDKDFDGDNIKDLAIVYTKKNDGANVVTVHLSSTKKNTTFPFHSTMGYNLEFDKNVLKIGACFGTGAYCQNLVFRYDNTLKTMRLIGYDEQDTGNNAHEGAYEKSVNFLNNKYEISGENFKKKLTKTSTFKPMPIGDLNEKGFEYLESIGSEYLKD